MDWPTRNALSPKKDVPAKSRPTPQVNLTGGIDADNSCSGNVGPIARLNFPGLCVSDAGNGLRSTDFVSSWPSGMSVGARYVVYDQEAC